MNSLEQVRCNTAWQLLEERVGGSTVAAAQYVWGVRYIDELVLRDRDANDDGACEERLYALQDPNWNVTALADASGAVVERYRYTPYGSPTVHDPSWTASCGQSAYAWDDLYTGRQLDPETGLQENRHRWLAPHLGLWITKDPVRYEADINLCRYVFNNPLSLVDDSGLAANWHHLLPVRFKGYFEQVPGLLIDEAKYGIILEVGHQTGESKIHPSWNRLWEEYIDKNPVPNKRSILAKLERMKADHRFAPILAKGVPAEKTGAATYRAWKSMTAQAREKVIREAEEQLLKKGGTRVTKKVGGKLVKGVVKRVPLVGLVFWVSDVQAKGFVGGTANTLLDQVPFLGWGKLGSECLIGDWIPDKE